MTCDVLGMVHITKADREGLSEKNGLVTTTVEAELVLFCDFSECLIQFFHDIEEMLGTLLQVSHLTLAIFKEFYRQYMILPELK